MNVDYYSMNGISFAENTSELVQPNFSWGIKIFKYLTKKDLNQR